MVLIINIITLGILGIIFIILFRLFAKNAFFSISILYKFTILLAPFLIFAVNLIYFYIMHSPNILLSGIPLLIPVIYTIYIKIQNIIGQRTYKKFKEFSKKFVKIAHNNNVLIDREDIRIRIKKGKDVSIIFNVYSSNDERKILSLLDEFQKHVNSAFKNYNVEFLIDKKKSKIQKYTTVQYN